MAIYIAIMEATNGSVVKDETYKILGKLEEKMSQMDNKINKIDLQAFNKSKDIAVDEGMQQALGIEENDLILWTSKAARTLN